VRYLKKYKIFESIEDDSSVISTIEDMSLDLEDTGLNVTVSKFSIQGDIGGTNGRVFIRIHGSMLAEPFPESDELNEFLTRVDNYMINNGFISYIISYSYLEESDWHEDVRAFNIKQLLQDIENYETVSEIRLYYKR